MSEEPRTFDEVAKEIAKERGISLVMDDFTKHTEEEQILSPSVIDEDNRKVITVIKKLEEWQWHPSIQRYVQAYVKSGLKKHDLVDRDKDGKEVNLRTSFKYFHYELSEKLFFYQDAVNSAIRYEDYNFSLRKKIIIFLGCRCVFCGNEDIDYLQLDHKNNKGGKERKRFKDRSLNPFLYYWNNLVEAYLKLQVLCIKCHKLKSTGRITQEDIYNKTFEEGVKK